jgi:hydrogenase nickel incorporation protein HypA/HybF
MHEFSLATSLLDLVRVNCPEGEILESITIEAGPMRGIEPQAMQWAWEAATNDTDLHGVKFELIQQPWKLHCPDCQTTFEADDMFTDCECGCSRTSPVDSDNLRLVRLTVKDHADKLV